MFKKIARKLVQTYINPSLSSRNESILTKSARFVACEMIEGDYYEFGVYQGKTFIEAYHWLEKQFSSRIALTIGGDNEEENRTKRRKIWKDMHFFAFDSFEGLPQLSSEDSYTPDFERGQYACSLEEFEKIISAAGLPLNKVHTEKGFFETTCTAENMEKLNLRKASIIWLDADLYSSTKDVLKFVTPLLQDGTIIIFDDWFSYKGNPYEGVQRAFNEWKETVKEEYVFNEYQRDSWKRISFISSKIRESSI